MIHVEWFYWLAAAIFFAVGCVRVRDTSDSKRVGSAAFWWILAFTFVYGSFVVAKTAPAWVEGIAVLALAVLAGMKLPGTGTATTTSEPERVAHAERLGNWLFFPTLAIPVVAGIVAVIGMKNVSIAGHPVLEPKMGSLIGLGVAGIVGLALAMWKFRVASPAVPLAETDRLLGHIGWAALLPQFLATLGVLFTAAGVGKAVGRITEAILPSGMLLAAVVVYCVGMALFTIIMGNAFAAFPVMTASVGWPVLIQTFGGDPASVFAVGMLAAFCGTLVTPMAANFNLVPAALLELDDKYGPIKAQAPTAALLLICNIVIMYFFCF